MEALSTLLESIAENLDQRRLEFTNIRRIVQMFVGVSLESAASRMAVPMIYAVWEGFVKEVCQLYLEHIEQSVSVAARLQPAILGHMWTPELRQLAGGLNFSKKKSVAEMALGAGSASVLFRTSEKEVNTRSNLKYDVLEDIANCLCLDISAMCGWRTSLNALVNLRNNIAHGERPGGLSYKEIDDFISTTLSMMEKFEIVLSEAARDRVFCTA